MLDLLDKIRPRPGMYIGYHSPTHLHSFLCGFSLATNFESSSTEEPCFDDFHDWVAKRLNYPESTSGWAYMIEDQREDKEEALWLFFELLDEFRNIKHESLRSIQYLSSHSLDTSGQGYSRMKKVRGSVEAIPKPRPTKLIIRKMVLDEIYYSLLALNEQDEVLDVITSQKIEDIYERGGSVYGVERHEWQ